jgi:hypothetical protein
LVGGAGLLLDDEAFEVGSNKISIGSSETLKEICCPEIVCGIAARVSTFKMEVSRIFAGTITVTVPDSGEAC